MSNNITSFERKKVEAFVVRKTRATRQEAAALSDLDLATLVIEATGRKVVVAGQSVAVRKRMLEVEVEGRRMRHR